MKMQGEDDYKQLKLENQTLREELQKTKENEATLYDMVDIMKVSIANMAQLAQELASCRHPTKVYTLFLRE
jgi:uncharacterized protein YfkK (UPF0435 family)